MIRIKTIVFSVVCFSGCRFCYSQNKNLDSLEKEMNSYKKKDTVRVKKILSYSTALFSTDLARAVELSKDAVRLATELEWDRGMINGLQTLSLMAGRNELYDQAISYALEALKISEDVGDKVAIIKCHLDLGEKYRLTGDTLHSFFHLNKGMELARFLDNKGLINRAMTRAISNYVENGKTDKAIAMLPEALNRAISAGDEKMQNELLEAKARILSDQQDYAGAIAAFKKLVLYYEPRGKLDLVAYYYCELSNNYTLNNIKDSAFFYAQKALGFSKKHGLKKELNDANYSLYNYYYTFGNFKKAFEFKVIYDSIRNETFSWTTAQNAERTRLQLIQERKDAIAEQEKIKKEAQTNQEKTLQFITIGIFFLIAVFLFVNNRRKQRSKAKIEKAYSKLKSTQAQLIQSEKMASLGELTAGIAHEIQNPLNFVNNFSEVNKELLLELKDEIKKGNLDEINSIADDIKNNEEKIIHHGKRADAIVKGMLQHSRVSTGQKESTDINALADEYLRLAYHGMRAKDKSFNATINTDFDESISLINIIPQDIGRVLLNLYNNAFYAVAEKKKQNPDNYEPIVAVTTKRLGSPLRDGGKIEIKVNDNGNGIPQKVLDKIFQPFFTTKPTGQGTGLGLSLAYDIVKAHGGELVVETEEGAYTDFIIQLPLSESRINWIKRLH